MIETQEHNKVIFKTNESEGKGNITLLMHSLEIKREETGIQKGRMRSRKKNTVRLKRKKITII